MFQWYLNSSVVFVDPLLKLLPDILMAIEKPWRFSRRSKPVHHGRLVEGQNLYTMDV